MNLEMNLLQNSILPNRKFYLTDGGLETTLIFHKGIELPHFAAFELTTYQEGKQVLHDYYLSYLKIAEKYNLNFILESPTWRANTYWGFKLGYSQKDLDKVNRNAVLQMHKIKELTLKGIPHVLVSGNIGPRGDGYSAQNTMNPIEAKVYHQPQINAFDEAGADMTSALTLNYSDEAIGIVMATQEADIPVVISFTVETDGKLPNGETLQEAIEKTDHFTGDYTSYYMINCAHPEHFKDMLTRNGSWKDRIMGIRANASTKSHAELDESETLDTGDKCTLANGYVALQDLLPNLRIFGGCCGTDHSHLEEICRHLFTDEKVDC